jgi:hypothetical protein
LTSDGPGNVLCVEQATGTMQRTPLRAGAVGEVKQSVHTLKKRPVDTVIE